MLRLALKVLVTSVLVVAVSEVARRSTLWGALLASLPLTSILAFVWMHLDGEPDDDVGALSWGILWLLPPSALLFVALPLLLRAGLGFWPSLLASCALTAGAYLGAVRWLGA